MKPTKYIHLSINANHAHFRIPYSPVGHLVCHMQLARRGVGGCEQVVIEELWVNGCYPTVHVQQETVCATPQGFISSAEAAMILGLSLSHTLRVLKVEGVAGYKIKPSAGRPRYWKMDEVERLRHARNLFCASFEFNGSVKSSNDFENKDWK